HPAPGSPRGTLVNALLAHCGATLSGVGGEKRPGVVHRIDKETSGLLVVAKSDAAHQGLAAQFAAHTVERAYRAVCYGVPSAADPRLNGLRGVNFEPGNVLKLTTHLARHKTDRKRQAVLFGGGRHAVTRVRIDDELAGGQAAVVTCRLETGRTHQIRVHMAYAGHGLIGDPTYGGRRALKGAAHNVAQAFHRQALHAAILGFNHPLSGQALTFQADMPDDMERLIRELS
ncbi:MAG: RluA family pseudouridine synthase, partial [Pseudomonadota bacterium]